MIGARERGGLLTIVLARHERPVLVDFHGRPLHRGDHVRPRAEDDRTSVCAFVRGADEDAELDGGRCIDVVDEDVVSVKTTPR